MLSRDQSGKRSYIRVRAGLAIYLEASYKKAPSKLPRTGPTI